MPSITFLLCLSLSLPLSLASAQTTTQLTHSSFQEYLLLNSHRQLSLHSNTKGSNRRGLEKQPSRLLRQDFQDQEGIADGLTQFQQIQESLRSLNYTSGDVLSVWNIVGAVLEIGNICFFENESPEGNVTELTASDQIYLNTAAEMLGIPSNQLCGCLTTSVSTVRGEMIIKPLNLSDSINAKNAVCKALYSSLFTYIVGTINIALSNDSFDETFTSIGVLDIFGFESFKQNEFEQVGVPLSVSLPLSASLSLSLCLLTAILLLSSSSIMRMKFFKVPLTHKSFKTN
jgi:hypothetical protein